MEKRPILDKYITINNFKDFYWLKEELILFCRKNEINTTGGKIEISERIVHFLKTNEKIIPKKIRKTSKFDWNKEKLTLKTTITDNYKNTENVRLFFTEQIGKHFKFNVKFMNWMKYNTEKTLNDALNKWKEIEKEKKNNKKTTKIAPQFEYNQYIRDFMADNPNSTKTEAIKYWKLKKSVRGSNKYNKSDLKLK